MHFSFGETAMIVLSAYYRGDVRPDDRKRFNSYLKNVHMPSVARWPGLRGLRLLTNDRQPYLEEAPQYYQAIELSFDSEKDLESSMASQERVETKELSQQDHAQFKDLFKGDILHTIYAATEIPVVAPGEVNMLRCAYYMGDVSLDREAWMDTFSVTEHLPDVARWPRLTRLRHLKKTGSEFVGQAPEYYHVYELSFASQGDIDIAMASEERKQTRKDMAEYRDPTTGRFFGFTGEVHHTNYTVEDFPVGIK